MATVPIEQLLYGLRQVETGGQKDPYRTVNSIGAHGAYQVMRANIGPWTKEALGRAYTPAEFLASPQAQDKVAAFRLERDMRKYGSWESAASVWFSGQPDPNKKLSDGGNTVPQYIQKVRDAMAKWKPGATVPISTGGTVTPVGVVGDLGSLVGGGFTDILKYMGAAVQGMVGPVTAVGAFAEFLLKLALPSTWVRIVCGAGGIAFILAGLVLLGREAKGSAA